MTKISQNTVAYTGGKIIRILCNMLQVGGPEPVGGSVIVKHSFCLWVQSDCSKEKKDNGTQKGPTSAHLPLSRNSSFGHACL